MRGLYTKIIKLPKEIVINPIETLELYQKLINNKDDKFERQIEMLYDEIDIN